MRLKESNGHVADKQITLSGEQVLLLANRSEAIVLSCNKDEEEPIWYIGTHLSVLAAEGEEIMGARWYHNRIGYVEQMHEGIAFLTEDTPPEVWSEIYAIVRHRANDGSQIFCPLG